MKPYYEIGGKEVTADEMVEYLMHEMVKQKHRTMRDKARKKAFIKCVILLCIAFIVAVGSCIYSLLANL